MSFPNFKSYENLRKKSSTSRNKINSTDNISSKKKFQLNEIKKIEIARLK